MTNDVVVSDKSLPSEWTEERCKVLKSNFMPTASNDEFFVFLQVCKMTRLNPFTKQIYPVPRGNKWSYQVSIDGMRLIAERTGKYMPGREPSFTYDDKGTLRSATAYIKKMGPDGQWHELSATAILDEYKVGNNPLWKSGPHFMLSKCAESLAIRRGFPADTSSVYTEEEMEKANKQPDPLIPENMLKVLEDLISKDQNPQEVLDGILSTYKISHLSDLLADKVTPITRRLHARRAKQLEAKPAVTIDVKPEPTADEVAALFE